MVQPHPQAGRGGSGPGRRRRAGGGMLPGLLPRAGTGIDAAIPLVGLFPGLPAAGIAGNAVRFPHRRAGGNLFAAPQRHRRRLGRTRSARPAAGAVGRRTGGRAGHEPVFRLHRPRRQRLPPARRRRRRRYRHRPRLQHPQHPRPAHGRPGFHPHPGRQPRRHQPHRRPAAGPPGRLARRPQRLTRPRFN